MTTLVWFRDDLRIVDHPALTAAAQDPDGLIALYVFDEESEHTRPLGGAARWWLHHSLTALAGALAVYGVPLILRRGPVEDVVPEVARAGGAQEVVWNRRYGEERHHDAALKTILRAEAIEVRSFVGDLLFEPWTIATADGRPYRVYSAFWRACTRGPSPLAPFGEPRTLRAASTQPASEDLDDWLLLPQGADWSTGLSDHWQPGERSARRVLDEFLHERVARYAAARDVPSDESGSRLSPHLRWGEISPRTVWHRAVASGRDAGMFLSELGWREFAKHTAHHFGPLHTQALNRQFDAFPWRDDPGDELRAWQQGTTGFGMVDAGMRELWETGFMHNRVRMITASFLTKNLLIDWRVGEAWFWDTLVDADTASNPFNWQWVAGCGADAVPYFRIFNPELQQQKFDRDGTYVGRWAPDSVSIAPLVDLRATRARALEAYEGMKNAALFRASPDAASVST